MKQLVLLLAMAGSLCTSCVQSCRDTTLYQKTGRQKAIVAVLPVICKHSSTDISWDISREFTDEIRKRVFDSSRLYLLKDNVGLSAAEDLNTPNPQDIPSSIAQNCGAAEYVVVAELIDQKSTPFGLRRSSESNPFHNEIGSVLSVSMRVRVIDVRQENPKVILQEVLEHEQTVPRAYIACDYQKNYWGSDGFQHTPMGLAHNRLVRELVSRVESYIDVTR